MLERFIERVIVENEWGLRARICDIYHAGWRHKKYWMSMTLSLAYRVNRMLVDQGRVDLTGIVTMRLHTNERAKMGFLFNKFMMSRCPVIYTRMNRLLQVSTRTKNYLLSTKINTLRIWVPF